MQIEEQKRYDHKAIEEVWTKKFSTAFKSDPSSRKKKFCITIPPPNITGSLHIGHALNMTIQDVIVRYKRMKNYEVLWVPGTDHAGIATQVVVLRELEKKGLKREDLSEEKFFKFVEEWREKSQSRIREQMEKLALSVDWSMNRFTLDPDYREAVLKAFAELYKDGLIYRGDYIINWCPSCRTALSDLEVEFSEEQGKLYYIIYPIEENGKEGITVATTRPETLLGDTAVAVHPEDERYSEIKAVYVPLVWRKVPVIRDERVDMTFGTGAVKITPAHDFADFEISNDHRLPRIKIMDENGVIIFGDYKGLERFEGRKKILEDLEAIGLLSKVEDYKIRIGRCYRCKTIVEPLLSKQWFLKTKELAKAAIEAVESDEAEGKSDEGFKKVKFLSENWKNLYLSWMSRIKDWCISRQLWWGHKIPAATCLDCERNFLTIETPSEFCPYCNSRNIKEEKDVLDTWFSSALWPFAVLGWPKKTQYLEAFYPTDMLVTGFDIIFFWVARMIMMGLYFMKQVPFKQVYVHGLIRDEKGQKMSKTKGNVLDPLDIVEKYGADTLRFTLSVLASQTKDIKLSEKTIESYYHFMNKIWNASRFVIMNVDSYKPKFSPKSIPQIWILGKLSECISKVEKYLDETKINQASTEIYEFFWNDFCDWYIEISKFEIQDPELSDDAKNTLVSVLDSSLRILHIFCPSITAHIWDIMKRKYNPPDWDADIISFAEFPRVAALPEEVIQTGETLISILKEIRAIKDYMGVKINEKVNVKLVCQSKLEILGAIKSNINWMEKLSGSNIEVCMTQDEGDYIPSSVKDILILVEARREKIDQVFKRMEQEESQLSAELEKIKKRLSNTEFLEKADEAVVEEHKKRFEDISFKLSHLQKKLTMMKKS